MQNNSGQAKELILNGTYLKITTYPIYYMFNSNISQQFRTFKATENERIYEVTACKRVERVESMRDHFVPIFRNPTIFQNDLYVRFFLVCIFKINYTNVLVSLSQSLDFAKQVVFGPADAILVLIALPSNVGSPEPLLLTYEGQPIRKFNETLSIAQ